VCDAGLYEAVAYLVLAQGTGKSNRLTKWSAKSLRTYTGIPFERGKPVIDRLKQEGFIRNGEKHSTSKPLYELLSWAEFVALAKERQEQKIVALGDHWRGLIDDIRNGKPVAITKTRRNDLEKLVEKGFLSRCGYNDYSVVECPWLPADPDYIWLPNTIVTGTDKGEDSPIRRLRSAGDIWTLRLFVDLYSEHSLTANGGINPFVIRQNYERKLIGEQGLFNIWAFKPKQRTLWWVGPFKAHESRGGSDPHPAWKSVEILEKQGLLTFVSHLWESDSRQAKSYIHMASPDTERSLRSNWAKRRTQRHLRWRWIPG
jgi:hypothetical protein